MHTKRNQNFFLRNGSKITLILILLSKKYEILSGQRLIFMPIENDNGLAATYKIIFLSR